MRRTTLALLLLVLLAAPAAARDPQDVANAVSTRVMSPFCPGVTLHDCPSDAANDLRDRITAWAEQGMTEDAIVDRLVAQYGTSIQATPPAAGKNLIAWLLPLAAVVIGLAVVFLLTRRFAARPASEETTVPITSEQKTRLDTELAQLRGES